MKIDDALRIRLSDIVGQNGGVKKFALRCGVDAANISRYLRGISRSIKDDNWEKLAPFLENCRANSAAGTPESFIAATAELTAFLAGRMKLARIGSVERLCQRMNFNNYETLRRQINGNLNWSVETLHQVFEVLAIAPEDAPLSDSERQLLNGVAQPEKRRENFRMLPVLGSRANGTPVMDGMVAVAGDEPPELRAFRISGEEMLPLLLPGDIVIAEETGSWEDIPDKALVLVRLDDRGGVSGQILCRRFRRIRGISAVLCSDAPGGEWLPLSPETVQWCGIVRRRISEFF